MIGRKYQGRYEVNIDELVNHPKVEKLVLKKSSLDTAKGSEIDVYGINGSVVTIGVVEGCQGDFSCVMDLYKISDILGKEEE